MTGNHERGHGHRHGPLATPDVATYHITRDAVRRFAVATGLTDEVHHDVAAARRSGYPDLLAPPYFFVSIGLSMGRIRPRSQFSAGGIALDDPLAAFRVVAGQTEVDWFGSMFAGDTIEVRSSFLGVERKSGRSGPFTLYTFRREYLRDGSLLVRETYGRVAR